MMKRGPTTHSLMFYVDFGIIQMVDKKNILRLDSLSSALNKYPYQAIMCRLHEIDETVTSNIVASLGGYLNPNKPAVVKVMTTRNAVPIVKIFVRFNEGPLCCINESVQWEQELESSPEIVDETVVPQFQSNSNLLTQRSPTTKYALNRPTIPSIGEMFEVHVTMAPNPHNFKVRSHRLGPQFQEMMFDFQAYAATDDNEFVADAAVKVGQVYACQQNDGHWYRAVVDKLLHESTFMIGFCDYGDVTIVHSERLKELPAQFRTLPMLAINAKLFGIAPKNQDWETEDCLYFQRMTVDKKFVSRIENIVTDEDGDTRLELQMIDVSTDTDVVINDELIKDGRAIRINC